MAFDVPLYSATTGLPLYSATTGLPMFGNPANCGCCTVTCPCASTEPNATITVTGTCPPEQDECEFAEGTYSFVHSGGTPDDGYCHWNMDKEGPLWYLHLIYCFNNATWWAYLDSHAVFFGYFGQDRTDPQCPCALSVSQSYYNVAIECSAGVLSGSFELPGHAKFPPDGENCFGCTAHVTLT